MNGYDGYRRNRTCPCQRCRISSAWGPAMLILIGILFLLDKLDVISFDSSWPLILVVVGGIMLARNNASTAGHISRQGVWGAAPAATTPLVSQNSPALQTLDQGK